VLWLTAARVSDHVPRAHGSHVELLEAPGGAEDHVPAAQDTQVVEVLAARVTDHLPCGHSEQVAELFAARAADHVPRGHAPQDVAAIRTEKVPPTQGRQADASRPPRAGL
jgi:hypothetical protein